MSPGLPIVTNDPRALKSPWVFLVFGVQPATTSSPPAGDPEAEEQAASDLPPNSAHEIIRHQELRKRSL